MAGIFPGLTRGTRRRYASLRSRVSAAPSHTGEPMQKTELDMPLDLPEHASEIALWAAVLRLMLEDAQRYWLAGQCYGAAVAFWILTRSGLARRL